MGNTDKKIERQASLLCGAAFFSTRALEEEGIRSLKLLDGGTGINFEQLFGDLYRDLAAKEGLPPEGFDNVIRNFFDDKKLSEDEKKVRDEIKEKLSTRLGGIPLAPGCYPSGIMLGASWDPDVVEETGRALGMEANAYKIDCLLGTPNLNILREPRNGRFFEGISEDPYLTGEIASSFIKGVQERGVAANAKHYVANNLEINRGKIDEHISRRALEEIYLPGFKACVDSGVKTIMAAYPKINGEYCVKNRFLLRDILKERWGFKGVVMTDWDACDSKRGDAVAAGTDLIMPGPVGSEDIIAAVNDGRLTEDELCDSFSRMKELAGYCDRPKKEVSPEEYISAGDQAAYKAASEGIVMLRNKNGAMPERDTSRYILFDSEDMTDHGDGSAQVFTSRRYPLKEYLPGCRVNDYDAIDEDTVSVIVCTVRSGEGTDRDDLKMPGKTVETYEKVAAKGKGRIVLVLNVPGPVEIPPSWDPDAVFVVFYPGMMGKKALADIMTGKISPSGKLPFTWPFRYEDTPAFLNYPEGNICNYGEDIYVGYRGYEKRSLAPLYPFGYGLTYGETETVSVLTGRDICTYGENIVLKVKIRNNGPFEVRQVVQAYTRTPGRDFKELRTFAKCTLAPGGEKDIELVIDTRRIVFFDEGSGRMIRKNGICEISVGTSSRDIDHKIFVRLTGGDGEADPGSHMTILKIRKHEGLTEELVKLIEASGSDRMILENAVRYDPSKTVSELYPELSKRFDDICTLHNRRV